jgi:hypothetical protein
MPTEANNEFGAEYFELAGAVLPCQVRTSGALHARSGERLLMLALLADAINIFLKGKAERRLLAETRGWIRGASGGTQAISFEDACDAIGIDPGALRERLFRLKYGAPRDSAGRRSSLMLKPPGVSRGPVKVAASRGHRSSRRRSASS